MAGLAAKDVIDVDLTVADPRAEHTYVPPLEPCHAVTGGAAAGRLSGRRY
ncbi:hypothetical protein [Amycolatopsis methanolica]